MSKQIFDVAIIGDGAAGALIAMALQTSSDGKISTVLVGDSAEPGRGVAYSTPHPQHLLNVPAGKMSALPRDPLHFVRWLTDTSEFKGSSTESLEKIFIPRHIYGRYLHTQLAQSKTVSVHGECIAITKAENQFVLELKSGDEIKAMRVVLALGHGEPHIPHAFKNVISHPHFLAHPWDFSHVQEISKDAQNVFILGTGLTMVDCVLSLTKQKWQGKITALSRHGLLPRGHKLGPGANFPPPDLTLGLAKNMKLFRRAIKKDSTLSWQSYFDALRPKTQELWISMSKKQKTQFLRHLRPYWEVHRHRMPPEIYELINSLIEKGQLEILGGRVQACKSTSSGFELTYESRSNGTGVNQKIKQIHPQVIINATGPLGNVEQDRRQLIQDLLKKKLIIPHPLGMGVEISENLEVLNQNGEPIEGIYALGGLTRGWGWEVTAVPDIREQAWRLSEILAKTSLR